MTKRAINSEVNSKVGSSLSPASKCPTKAEVIATGKATVSGYENNQLIDLDSVNRIIEYFTITFKYSTTAIEVGLIPMTTLKFDNAATAQLIMRGTASNTYQVKGEKGKTVKIAAITSNYGYQGISVGDTFLMNKDYTVNVVVGGI